MSHVYFIRACMPHGLFKIGSSALPANRLRSCMAWSPVPLELVATCAGDVILERRFHALLRDHHSHAEWFHPAPVVVEIAEAVAAGRFDFGSLPPPLDIRNKANSVGDGLGPLAVSISMRLNVLAKRGVVPPPDVMAAARRFSNNPYQVGHDNVRRVEDAVAVCEWLDQHVTPSETARRRLADALARASQ